MRTNITIAQEHQLLALPTFTDKKNFLRSLRRENGITFLPQKVEREPTPAPVAPKLAAPVSEPIGKKHNIIATHYLVGTRPHIFSMR